MKKIALYLLLCIVVYSTGCPKYLPKNNIALDKIVKNYIDEIEDLRAKYDCATIGLGFLNTTKRNRVCGGVVPNVEQVKQLRNKIIYRLNYLTDVNYNQFIIDLRAGRATTNVLADLTELGAGVAAAITNGERAIHIIAVAMTAFKGGRKSVDLNYFRERTTDVLINQMEASRTKVLTTVTEKMKEDTGAYPLEAALGDLIEYFYAGSLDTALRDLEQNVGTNAQTAKVNLLSARGVKISSIPGKTLADNNKASKNKLEELQNDFDASGALRPAAVTKMRQALTDLNGNPKAAPVIEATLNGTAAADDVATLAEDKLLKTLLSILKLAENDEELATVITKALKVKP